MQPRGLELRATERMATMGDVLWVLVVIGFWMFVGVLMVVFIRIISRSHDDEETVCDVPEPIPAHNDDQLATT
jgi:hypothetical protein